MRADVTDRTFTWQIRTLDVFSVRSTITLTR